MSQKESQPISQRKYSEPSKLLRYQCPLCKELTILENFETNDEGIAIVCSECEGIFFYRSPRTIPFTPAIKNSLFSNLEKTKSQKETEATSINKEEKEGRERGERNIKTCPKCSTTYAKENNSCPNCGLLFSNIGRTFVPTKKDEVKLPQKEMAISLWEALLPDWENLEAQDKFTRFCMSNDLVDFASASYLDIKKKGGQYSKLADKQINAILLLAQEQYLQQRDTGEDTTKKVKRWKFILSIILLSFGALAFYIIWRASSK